MNINRDPLCSQMHLPLNFGFECISYKHRSSLDHGLYVLFAKEGFFFTCHTLIQERPIKARELRPGPKHCCGESACSSCPADAYKLATSLFEIRLKVGALRMFLG